MLPLNKNKFKKLIGSIIFSMFGFTMNAMAGGFQLFEENVTNLGNAYAGTSAQADDASTEFFNPAGMTRLDNGQVVLSGTYIDLDANAEIKSATSTFISSDPGVAPDISPVSGTTEARPGVAAAVPAFHFVYPFDHKWALGFGVTAPFGLETNYPSDSMARFMATKSQIQVINLGPSVAYQLTPKFSLGVGIDSQYMSATFDQAIADLNGETAGTFTNDGDNWAWGWHAGALYQFSPCTRVGLNYHSRVKHKLKGDALLDIEDFDVLGFELADRLPGKFTATTTLPDYADLSIYHQFSPEWAFLGSVEFTHWSTIKNVVATYSGDIANNAAIEILSASLPFDFNNTWRLAGGLNFMPSEKWTLRTGVAYDQSPVPSSTSEHTFRLPDSDRFWLAFGAQYIINRAFTVDAGYSHLFVNKSTLNNTQSFNALVLPDTIFAMTTTVVESGVADFDSSVNELGVQVTWNIPNSYS